jgi:hypothetical protein
MNGGWYMKFFVLKRFMVVLIAVVFSLPLQTVFAEDDDHFIQSDDYFISSVPYTNQAWIYVYIAKVVTPPTAKTKGEGQFMQVIDGKKLWTKYFWATRIATESDIKIGREVIALDAANEEDVYRVPENKEEARTARWFMARVTDVSDLFKGYVTVSGGYKVSVQALRIAEKATIKGE